MILLRTPSKRPSQLGRETPFPIPHLSILAPRFLDTIHIPGYATAAWGTTKHPLTIFWLRTCLQMVRVTLSAESNILATYSIGWKSTEHDRSNSFIQSKNTFFTHQLREHTSNAVWILSLRCCIKNT